MQHGAAFDLHGLTLHLKQKVKNPNGPSENFYRDINGLAINKLLVLAVSRVIHSRQSFAVA